MGVFRVINQTHLHTPEALDDSAWHGPDVGSAMTSNVMLVTHTTYREKLWLRYCFITYLFSFNMFLEISMIV